MEFNTVVENIAKRAETAKPLGNTLKFDFGDQKVYIDGTGESNIVTQEDKESDTTLKLSLEDFLKLTTGDLNPMMAVMSGKVKIEGDRGVALKIQSLL